MQRATLLLFRLMDRTFRASPLARAQQVPAWLTVKPTPLVIAIYLAALKRLPRCNHSFIHSWPRSSKSLHNKSIRTMLIRLALEHLAHVLQGLPG